MLQLLSHSVLELNDFLNKHISQGSVGTCLRRREMFSDSFIANLLLNLLAKEFEKLSTFGNVAGKSMVTLWHSLFGSQCSVWCQQ